MRRFRMLGPLEVERDGVAVDLGGRKQRAVLGSLLLAGGNVVSTDRLIDAVWGEDPPASAMSSLHAYVSNLRKVLRDEDGTTSPIQRRAHGYLVDALEDEVDAPRFRGLVEQADSLVRVRSWQPAAAAAERALELWGGPLLADFADEDWVRVLAAAYDEHHAAVSRDLVTARLGLGRLADGLVLAQDLVQRQPLDERACWLLAIALHRNGRTAEALEVLRDFGSRLDEELGLEPGVPLRELHGGLLRQDPGLDRWPGSGSVATVELPVERATASAEDALVGRTAELAAVRRAWAGGGAPWLLLTGSAGLGKSRLAREAVRTWPGDTVTAVCPDDTALPTWWPLRQLLRSLGTDPEAVLRVEGTPDPEQARFEVYDRVASALAEAARRRPLLVYVDDTHWADPATLTLLTHLATTCHEPGLAFLLTARDEILATAEGGRLVAAIARRPDGTRLALPPLTSSEVAALVAQVTGSSPADLDELTRRSGGNPFFVTELARLPAEQRPHDVPDAVRVVLTRRLATLPPSVRAVLARAAVVGEVVDLPTLRAVTGLTPTDLAEPLDAAADEGIIVLDRAGGGYTFVHALMRDALLAELPPVTRQGIHLAVAEALAGRADAVGLAVRARHLEDAGALASGDVVVAACRAAAEDAERRWDPAGAARWWEAGLRTYDARPHESTYDRDDLVAPLVAAWTRSGQGQRVLDLIDESLLQAFRDRRWSSVGRLARMLTRLTGAWPWVAFGSSPGPLLTRLAGLEPQMSDQPAARARVLAALAIGRCYDLDPEVPDRLSASAISLASSTGDPRVLVDALLGRVMTYSGVAERASETLELLARVGELLGPDDLFDQVIVHGVASISTMVLGDMPATWQHVRSGIDLATALRLPVNLAQLRWAELALTLWGSTDVSDLGPAIDAVSELHGRTQLTQSVTRILAELMRRWEQGRLADGLGVEVDNPFVAPWINAAIAAARREPAAPAILAAEIARPEPTSWVSLGRLALLAHSVADLGLASLAPPLISALEPFADCLPTLGHNGVFPPVSLALARLSFVSGDVVAARTYLARASDLARRAGGHNALLRCRLLALQLGDPDPTLAAEARAAGLLGVTRAAERP